MNKAYVIGIGYRPVSDRAREIMLHADVILTSNRLQEVFSRYDEFQLVREKVMLINKVDQTIAYIHEHIEKCTIVLLASGDPLFFGIGRKVLEEFGQDKVEILPDLSSIQVAFARIKEPWDNAFLMSLHGGPDPEKRRRLPYELKDIPALLKQHNKIAILTDKENNPAVIASFLNSSPITHYPSLALHVCERLGYPDEKVISGTPEEIAGMSFGNPNVVILRKDTARTETSGQHFGLREDEIAHSRGLITKDEIRAVSLHRLRLPQKGVFWDIGAGSGSISIEAAGLCPELRVYSVEKNEEQINNIKRNIVRFGAANIEVISGEAPEILRDLPCPDRIFVGGSSGHLDKIVDLISRTIVKGIIVINATTLETLNQAMEALATNGFEVDISEISVSRSRKIGSRQHMSALNPVFIIKGEKQ